MITFTMDQLNGWIGQFLWPFMRVLGLIVASPIFSESRVPNRVKIGLSLMLTLAIAPAAGAMPHIDLNSYQALLVVVQETMIGLAMGLVMRVVFAAVQTGGEFIGLQMGLSFASFFDPLQGGSTSVMPQFINIIATMLFLSVNGHLLLLAILAHSFETLPVGLDTVHRDGWGIVAQWGQTVFSSGLLLALPLICALLTMNLALGVLNRAAPQLTVFSIGFPVSLLSGLLLLIAVLPHSMSYFESIFQQGYDTLGRLIFALAGR